MFKFKPYFLQILGEGNDVYSWGVDNIGSPYGRLFKSMPSVFTVGWGIGRGLSIGETYRKLNGYTYSWYTLNDARSCFNIKNLPYCYIAFEDIN